jgi:hypothetical protein
MVGAQSSDHLSKEAHRKRDNDDARKDEHTIDTANVFVRGHETGSLAHDFLLDIEGSAGTLDVAGLRFCCANAPAPPLFRGEQGNPQPDFGWPHFCAGLVVRAAAPSVPRPAYSRAGRNTLCPLNELYGGAGDSGAPGGL